MRMQKWIWKSGVAVLMCGLVVIVGCDGSCTDNDNAATPVDQPDSSCSDLQALLDEISSSDHVIDEKTGERWLNYQVKLSDKALVPQMIELLKRDDSDVKLMVIGILWQLGKEASPALPAIRECLKNHDRMVRSFAQEAIEKIENPKGSGKDIKKPIMVVEKLAGPAVESPVEPTVDPDLQALLAGMSSSDRGIRDEAAVRGLGYQVRPSDKALVLVPQMVDLLKQDDFGVRLAVFKILRQLGKEAASALPAIRDCLKSSDKMVCVMAQATIDTIENAEKGEGQEGK